MAEAARRYQQTGGSDLVRRLIARPVRQEHQARTRLSLPSYDPDPTEAEAEEADAIARLEAELAVTKAVLRAQRQEVEALRAQRRLMTEAGPDEDVRATRERWAALVDSLLIRAR
ncbi:hypothetical protein Q8W71_12245 [Methylobacterium sp. NEAU 140]|uniref:hypothetical protein n=1 Tax=Methylobacterium sp. NEAU 140 TaxID=3064945 RepID=UPI0027371F1F|nr:hypothetical protein [Methylobacterium sp. NEAU 140]MDP4023400.1 hypothetical protein [Methylobacterium sp. NEAU 140]